MTLLRRVALVLGLLAVPAAVRAQVTLTVTGGPVSFPAPAVADFDNGYIDATGSVTYQVSGTGFNFFQSHTTIISVRSTGATLNGTVPVSTLTWRRADLTAWNPMTTTNTQIESRTFQRFFTNDPWSNSVFFRLNLSYAGDPPGTYSTSLVITVTVTTP